MTDASFAIFAIEGTTTRREISLDAYLDAVAEERAALDSHAWIKSLRHAVVDGQPLRQRFTYRGDSLWWFAELYLHKQQVITSIFRTLAALEALVAREQPRRIAFVRGHRIAQRLAPRVAARHGISYTGPTRSGPPEAWRIAAMDARASSLNAAAFASRFRARRERAHEAPDIVAFVHRAFWRADTADGSAEAYIGPVLSALERAAGKQALAYVSVGPSSNFRARRWWHPLRTSDGRGATGPIETFAPLSALSAARQFWKERHGARRALQASDDLRQRSTIHGCDCWPIVRDELAGVALLQWTWSARAMDEAAAALDRLTPKAAVTYAEAGGWGRAIALESRRRHIPLVGLQHGFIYRHWLNYLHEPDEMLAGAAGEAGFPAPDLTLLFDDYAAQHLREAGKFRAETLKVTGSARLDAMVAEARRLSPADITRARESAGAATRALVLVTTKYREAREVLPTLADAAATLPDVQLVIKTHPAETPDVYADVARARPHVTVLPAAAPLAPLLAASRVVVTVNSTVALDAAVLGIPALVIGLPNNLSPFVTEGVMAGVEGATVGDTAHALQRILYDEEFRHRLERAQQAFLTRYHITADGHAADRAAAAIVELTRAKRAKTDD